MIEEKRRSILSIRDLEISFTTSSGILKAIRGIKLDLFKGETVAIVGESGSGKSVTVKAVMGILSNNGTINNGSIIYTYKDAHGNEKEYDIVKMTPKEIRKEISGKRVAMVFQDPMTSLNPTMTIGNQIMEGMQHHYKTSKAEAKAKAEEFLRLVGIDNPAKRMKQYPNQLSGGMRQRVVIAIALSCEPDILICDEPTTALDVTVQAKILELIKDIQRQKGVSVIYITHDLGVVAKVADYVAVMYAGRIVEKGAVEEIFYDPRHPYTWGLLSSIPDISTLDGKLYSIPGSPINLINGFEGDAFALRNEYALNIDFRLNPPMFNVGGKHRVATWLAHENAPKIEMPKDLRRRIDKMLQGVGKDERKAYIGC
ncbi:ABC transporter ATP-binding protein [Lutispora sp.]|uniref:ABC transporter ATP-binding protein n=1 Tax=Lutispora sp. TaxID=2828727 RepID=UPI000EE015AA|nr:ABC transporter ATP-binding protein [Lutispora sp.]MEA4963284.1 ABC transporter ATP-binding protein [Lutispora sp.]HCJ57560.1 peptide ABC transporter ATP-binding protein [Clostridiaceae bacterium]